MKRSIFTIFLLISTFNLFSQSIADWFWIAPKPTGFSFHAAQFVGNNRCYAVGSYTIMRSNNSGLTWTTLNAPREDWGSLYFANSNTGYVLSVDAKLVKTVNGGTTWNYLNFPTAQNNQSLGMSFSGPDTGVVMNYFGNCGKLYVTHDGGISWAEKSLNICENYASVKMVNSTTGYANGNFYSHPPFHTWFVSKTIDAGNTWNIIDTTFPGGNTDPGRMYFLNASTGFLGTSQAYEYIFKTTDGGFTWNSMNIIDHTTDVSTISFTNATTGIAVGRNTSFLRTTDAGNNWSRVNYSDTLKNYNYVASDQNGRMLILGDNGVILRSSNSGSGFTRLGYYLTDNNFTACSFINANTGIAAGTKSTIFKTVNGGVNWTQLFIDSTFDIKDVKMVNQNVVYIVGNSRFVYKSINGGTTWSKQLTEADSWNSIAFIDAINGCIAGSSCIRVFAKTTDGGQTWVHQGGNHCHDPIQGSYYLWEDVAMGTPDQIVLGGYQTEPHATPISEINTTSNGGINWTGNQTAEQEPGINSVCFAMNNPNFGYASGGYNKNYVSHDGFRTWVNLTAGQQNAETQRKVSFLDSLNGYSILYKTTNGGLNWYSNNEILGYASDIAYTNSNVIYMVSAYGQIIKTTNGGSTLTGIKPGSTNMPGVFKLGQNYPNPFNPSTKITYEVPAPSNVKIIIYDISGREVARLLDSYMQPGKYDISWNASDFASGVYFYSMQTSDYTNVKKMVLVK